MTFRQLDNDIPTREPASTLEKWYERVRDVELEEFTLHDLARSCRQQLFPAKIVPICLSVLEQDPLAGDDYEGGLIVALHRIDKEYWTSHVEQSANLLRLTQLADELTNDEDLHLF